MITPKVSNLTHDYLYIPTTSIGEEKGNNSVTHYSSHSTFVDNNVDSVVIQPIKAQKTIKTTDCLINKNHEVNPPTNFITISSYIKYQIENLVKYFNVESEFFSFISFLRGIKEEIIYPTPDLDGKTNFEKTLLGCYKMYSQRELTPEEVLKINESLMKTSQNFFINHSKKKVKDDNSQPLKVILLENEEEFKKRFRNDGLDLFYQNTGGGYIEGNPANEKNQPVIYCYRSGGKIPFHILEHEFWHYLDSKYIKYGGSEKIPYSPILWWSEGSASYNVINDHSKKDLKEALKIIPRDSLPTLTDIIYPKFNGSMIDQQALLYTHSVWVHAFLDSSEEMRAFRKELEEALRNEGESQDCVQDFMSKLLELNINYSESFREYLLKQWDSDNPEFEFSFTKDQKKSGLNDVFSEKYHQVSCQNTITTSIMANRV